MTEPVDLSKRLSLWLLAAAMVLIVGLKSVGPWHWWGWPLILASVFLARRQDRHGTWWRTTVLLAYLIALLFMTHINGDTSNSHVFELVRMLGVGILIVPALLARYWLGEPLDNHWFNGRWSLRMWLWLPAGFALGYGLMWVYFNLLTPTLHHSWPLPLTGDRTEPMWRLFWGCNFVGIWDELAFINLVLVLLRRHFSFAEANLVQAVFFTSFLHEMAFVGWGPPIIYGFALLQGFTYRRTGSLFYIVILHLMFDSILFYMIANRWYPGWGWHPW